MMYHSNINYFGGHYNFYLTLSTFVLLSTFSSSGWNFVNGQNNTDLELLAWNPPLVLMGSFPYFLSAYDKDGVTVWVVEAGKFDVRSLLENEQTDEKVKGQLVKYGPPMFLHCASPELYSRPGDDGVDPQKVFIVIADMDQFNFRQMSHPPTLQTWIRWTIYFTGILQRKNNLLKAYVVNSNFVVQTLLSVLSPIFGSFYAKTDVLGTNERMWKPRLLSRIPKSQLPEWLGGSKDHVPVKVYG